MIRKTGKNYTTLLKLLSVRLSLKFITLQKIIQRILYLPTAFKIKGNKTKLLRITFNGTRLF